MRGVGQRLVVAPAGHAVSPEVMAAGQAQRPEIEIMLAISYVKTRSGAERIYWAEWRGRGRTAILAAASRRMDDFDSRTIPRVEAQSTTKETKT